MTKSFTYSNKKFITVKTGDCPNRENVQWVYARLEKGRKIWMGNIVNGQVVNLERTTATV